MPGVRLNGMKSTDLSLHRADLNDLDTLAGLFDCYRVFYQQDSAPEKAREFLQQRLRAGDSVVFLATLNGEAAGFTQLYPTFTSVGMARIWILNDLFVHENCRRNGVAKALMAEAQKFAVADGAAGMALETQKENGNAAALYRQLGWKLESEYDYYSLNLRR